MSLSAEITQLSLSLDLNQGLTPKLLHLLYQAQREKLAAELGGFPVNMIHQIKTFGFI